MAPMPVHIGLSKMAGDQREHRAFVHAAAAAQTERRIVADWIVDHFRAAVVHEDDVEIVHDRGHRRL